MKIFLIITTFLSLFLALFFYKQAEKAITPEKLLVMCQARASNDYELLRCNIMFNPFEL